MQEHLLWFETLLKFSSGVVLVSIPMALSIVMGLARPASRFWPRALGGVLIGCGVATGLEVWRPGIHALGLPGCIAINWAGAAVLLSLAVLGQAAPTARGRIAVTTAGGLLILLSLIELAYV